MTGEDQLCLCGHPRTGWPGHDHDHPHRLGAECKACACPVYVPANVSPEHRRSLRNMALACAAVIAAAALVVILLHH